MIRNTKSLLQFTGLMLAALIPTSTFAADFQGSLTGVTITDAASTNIPPVAKFSYSQEADTITFDAGSSTDSDGSITKYKWDFSDGTKAEGLAASYTLSDPTAKIQVTLTIIDNNNGVALTQQTISPSSNSVFDDFSINSTADYTVISGGLDIHDGLAYSNSSWTSAYAIHNNSLKSGDHFVEATVYTDGSNSTGGVIFRFDTSNNTGYLTSFSGGKVVLYKYSAGKNTWLSQFAGGYSEGNYQLRAETQGNSISISVNGNVAIQTTDNSYLTGNSIGLYLKPNGKGALITVDNLAGE